MTQMTYRLTPVALKRYRVIQWFTGQIALEQVRLMNRSQHFELVGAVCYHAEKDGRDVGDLAGIGPIGITATTDADAMMAVDADAVLLNGVGGEAEIDLIEQLLQSGKNVISIMGPWDARVGPYADRLRKAAEAGNVSFHGAGNMPGMLNDVLPSVLSSYTGDIKRIWTQERSYHGTYRGRDALERFLGYGRPLSEHGPDTEAGAPLVAGYVDAFHQAHYTLADSCGKIGDTTAFETRLTNYDAVGAPEDFVIETCGLPIDKGTVAGFRYEITSSVDGEPWAVIEVEHVAQVGLGQGWRETVEDLEFAISISGHPSIEFRFGTVPDDTSPTATMGLVELNAARIVNLIPAVVAAPPGLATYMDLPIITAVH